MEKGLKRIIAPLIVEPTFENDRPHPVNWLVFSPTYGPMLYNGQPRPQNESICKVSSTPPCHKGCDRAACGEELDFHAHKKHYTENDYYSSWQSARL
jgi:hypothetical protein